MKTYILGDIHGEYKRSIEILSHVGILDDNAEWSKGLTDTLIQIGDVIDRGDEIIESFKLFRDLQEQAKEEGGAVIRLLGNHELGYIGGPAISSRPEGYKLAHVIKGDILAGKITAAYRLYDWVVVHAGITPNIAGERDIGELVDEFNEKLIYAVERDDFSDEIFAMGRSRGGYMEPGIFWADYSIDLIPYEDELVQQVVGHSPQHRMMPSIKRSPGGRVINVDIGICTMYGGNRGILVYEDGEFTPIIF